MQSLTSFSHCLLLLYLSPFKIASYLIALLSPEDSEGVGELVGGQVGQPDALQIRAEPDSEMQLMRRKLLRGVYLLEVQVFRNVGDRPEEWK